MARTAWRVAAVGLVVAVGVGIGLEAVDPPSRLPQGREEFQPGVDRPLALPARGAPLRDDAPVLGVVVGARARAYSVAAMSAIARHVVNDIVGDMPVAVTYCDRTGCARAYAGAAGGGPLGVGMAGFDRGLVLTAGGRLFRQDTGEAVVGEGSFPFAGYPVEQTTWGAWKAAHPDTDVYIGDERPSWQQ